MQEPNYVINVLGDHTTITVNCPEEETSLIHETRSGSVNNCYLPDSPYHARVQLDQKLRNIQKGKVQILYGPTGTGKRSAALHFIDDIKEKFSVSWRVDCSEDEDNIHSCLFHLAERLTRKNDQSFSQLFQVIKEKAEKENVIFLLDNLQQKRPDIWLKELWKIKDSLYIIVTTNNASLDLPFPDVEKISVDKFDEAVNFLTEAKEVCVENTDDDVKELCDHFSWNVLGLTSAKIYTTEMHISIQDYLEMLRDKEAAPLVRKTEQEKQNRTLYAAVRACFEQIDKDRFPALAAISLIVHERIPEFLLSSVFPSSSAPARRAYLCDLQSSLLLKSLVHITNENNVRFFSFHKFTQSVVRDLLDEEQDLRKALIYKMAGILAKYFNKDNHFRKDAFMQRILVNHAETFLQQWSDYEVDDRTLIVLARLSELVGFTYTQRQPVSEDSLKIYFQRAEDFLHKLCGITPNDFEAKIRQENDTSLTSLGIHAIDISTGQHLYKKLSQKSSQLSNATVHELAFSRTINSEDLLVFPKVVRDSSSLKKKVNSFEPLSERDIDFLISKGVAYTVDDYRKLFLPELYASVLYSYGRCYFYLNKKSVQKPSFYIDRLKLAYCISCEITKRMKPGEAVMHEHLAQSNGLLYLLVNREVVGDDGCLKTKEQKEYSQDLKNAAKCYQTLSQSEIQFFEMSILKKNKDDKLCRLVCQHQIVQCYIKLLSPEMTTTSEERDQVVRDGVEHCEVLLKLVHAQSLQDDSGRVTKGLQQFSKYLNVVGEFYLAVCRDDYLLRAWRMFIDSAVNAEVKEEFHDRFSLQALVGLSDVFSRLGKQCFIAAKISNLQLKHCNRLKNYHEILHHQPNIAEKVVEIEKRNTNTIEKRYAKLWRRAVCVPKERVADDVGSETTEIEIVDNFDSTDHDGYENNLLNLEETIGKDQVTKVVRNACEGLSRDVVSDGCSTEKGYSGQRSPLNIDEDNESRSTDYETHKFDVLMENFQRLAAEIPDEWKKLARFLHVRDAKIKEITLNNPNDVVEQAYQMLRHWWTNYSATSQSWSECLGKALCERLIGRNDLAKKFANYSSTSETTTSDCDE